MRPSITDMAKWNKYHPEGNFALLKIKSVNRYALAH